MLYRQGSQMEKRNILPRLLVLTTRKTHASMKKPTPLRPKPGQESVWNYPRPPRVEPTNKTLTVIAGGETIAQTNRGFRVLETSHPPVYYFPQEDVNMAYVRLHDQPGSFCEWKGRAFYGDVVVKGQVFPRAAWGYHVSTGTFSVISDYLAFYASRVDKCLVNDEVVIPQAGDFYGGWITADIVGPFKGEEGTWGW